MTLFELLVISTVWFLILGSLLLFRHADRNYREMKTFHEARAKLIQAALDRINEGDKTNPS